MCAAGCTHLMYLTWSSYISTNYDASFYADFSTLPICCQHHILTKFIQWCKCFICIFFSKIYYKIFVTEWETYTVFRCNFRASLDWFGLFVHPFSHTCKNGHINYRLQFIYYNITYNIWTSTQYNIINNNTKFKGQLEVEFVTTSRYTVIPLLTSDPDNEFFG